MRYHIDVAHESLCKSGEELCGDRVEIIRGTQDVIIVLSDGLGSGVKANILATLTGKILSTMLSGGATIAECVETIASTLPVCAVRGIAYSTFSVLRIDYEGNVSLVQYDSPEVVLLANGHPLALERDCTEISGKQIWNSRCRLQENDILTMFSDGVIHAGVGMLLNLGWQQENVVKYLEQSYTRNISAIGMAHKLLSACDSLYMQKPGDDTTVVAVKLRKPVPVCVMVGPPVNADDDRRVVDELLACSGRKVVCGGTTSQIVSKLTGEELQVDLKYVNPAIPPTGSIKGIDLVTEGVITLGKTLDIIRSFCSPENIQDISALAKMDGATRLAQMLLEQGTEVRFLVGRAINPAHQNPALPIALGIKLRLVDDIASCLRSLGREVTIEQY